ncbi:hypothetical protein CEXT_611721 [Caerostris extrusa]|uniref:Uncharacterized protein n=1 Tax=Caerostris extrusa TaxID=172846 RepID=A0AAV4TPU2_CAEEX|nr:hypothetical protein CEXT_611721 [Caerostris extrusa]
MVSFTRHNNSLPHKKNPRTQRLGFATAHSLYVSCLHYNKINQTNKERGKTLPLSSNPFVRAESSFCCNYSTAWYHLMSGRSFTYAGDGPRYLLSH